MCVDVEMGSMHTLTEQNRAEQSRTKQCEAAAAEGAYRAFRSLLVQCVSSVVVVVVVVVGRFVGVMCGGLGVGV